MIDVHTHPVMIRELVERDPRLASAVKEVFGLRFPAQPLEIFLQELNEAEVDRAVLLPIDCRTAHDCTIVSNDQIRELMDGSERFIGFASVDPHVPGAAKELERAVRELGLKGLKLDPSLQRFDPASTKEAFPLYERCLALDVPVMVHCGLSLAPVGVSADSRPIGLEAALMAFPELKLIIPHLGWPYVEEALMLAAKFENVYLDTSAHYGGAPHDTLPHLLLNRIGRHVVESALQFRLLFGSNYPRIDIRRCARAARSLDIAASTRRNLLEDNAVRLLKLEAV